MGREVLTRERVSYRRGLTQKSALHERRPISRSARDDNIVVTMRRAINREDRIERESGGPSQKNPQGKLAAALQI